MWQKAGVLLRALAVWLAIMLLAITNGAAREALLAPRLGERTAHVASTAILCLAILAAAWLSIGWMAVATMAAAWIIGALWLALTLAFELLAGQYLFGASWEKLLADYNLAQGRVWPLVPLCTLVAPPLAYVLR